MEFIDWQVQRTEGKSLFDPLDGNLEVELHFCKMNCILIEDLQNVTCNLKYKWK